MGRFPNQERRLSRPRKNPGAESEKLCRDTSPLVMTKPEKSVSTVRTAAPYSFNYFARRKRPSNSCITVSKLVRGRAILDCLSHHNESWAIDALKAAAPHALAYHPTAVAIINAWRSCWINGQFVTEDEASIPLRDTGLLHAAACFTTFRAHNAKYSASRITWRACAAPAKPSSSFDVQDEILTAAATGDSVAQQSRRRPQCASPSPAASPTRPLHGLRLSPTTFLTATPSNLSRRILRARDAVLVLDDQKRKPL